MAREINLVPDVKNEMIKALKLRNLIFFICIVVASASVAVSVIFASIAGGQQAIVNGKKETIAELSDKISSYSDLKDFLTIKDQLGNLSSIAENKKLLSRTFGILTALLPTGLDTITLSELQINLVDDEPTISFDGQANANSAPFIDYNVLDSFKKSMQYMRYDYGEYVDKNGETIPAYCMVESGADGATFYDADKQSYYAYWLISGDGCDPSYEEDVDSKKSKQSQEEDKKEEIPATYHGYDVEAYENQIAVRVWRTPQFNDWYSIEEKAGKPYMSLDGDISNVPHFVSECTTYYGTEAGKGVINWESYNNDCKLVPDGADGINITGSSNGRDASSELVLRFSATITLAEEAFDFNNKHLMAIGPTGRHNVTDSYVQIQNMFAERANDCAPGDAACSGGGN